MKNKFIVLTLCFTIVFSSINFNNTYAFNDNDLKPLVVDGGVISVPMLAVVSTVALGTGLAIKNIEDIYSVGSSFYNHFKDSWSNVVDTFNKNVFITAAGVVTVGSAFLELLTQFLPSYNNSPTGLAGYWGDIPIYNAGTESVSKTLSFDISSGSEVKKDVAVGIYLYFVRHNSSSYKGTINLVGASAKGNQYVHINSPNVLKVYGVRGDTNTDIYCVGYQSSPTSPGKIGIRANQYYDLVSPSNPNVYDDTIINKNKDEKGDLPIYVPGNLVDLPGTSTNDVFVNNGTSIPYNPPVDGVVSVPGIDDPSIDVDTDITFPGVNDVPTDTPFANITEYIVGLVVPSDSYWTDTFGGLHNNFSSSFPMVDMSGFNSLAVDGKPFPNIDIKIMGSSGRVVNGDTVNSIVNWLRPIIAGFIFICLMFFNYRKIYKLIRNSEPFEGIGKVENHAN